MRITGFRAFIAPCGIIANLRSFVWRICSALSVTRSTPSRIICPPSIFPGGLIIRINAWAIVDLPEPDSPTNPILVPSARSNVTSSTAFTAPAST